jgi:hypothetical protein
MTLWGRPPADPPGLIYAAPFPLASQLSTATDSRIPSLNSRSLRCQATAPRGVSSQT